MVNMLRLKLELELVVQHKQGLVEHNILVVNSRFEVRHSHFRCYEHNRVGILDNC